MTDSNSQPKSLTRRPLWMTILIVVVLIVLYVARHKGWPPSDAPAPAPQPPVATTRSLPDSRSDPRATPRSDSKNDSILRCFESKLSYEIVTGSGRVVHLLPDDTDTSDGSGQHQKFLVDVSPDLTIRLVNNIDPGFSRIPVHVGDVITFKGEYLYNDKGGTVHWTHHDPARRHADGWVELNGKKYD